MKIKNFPMNPKKGGKPAKDKNKKTLQFIK